MTIGPEPMMSIFLMSVRLGMTSRAYLLAISVKGTLPVPLTPIPKASATGYPAAAKRRRKLVFLHHLREAVEQVMRIMRPGRSLGMVLHAEQRQRAMAHAFVGVIVQVDVGDFHIARWQGVRVHDETMILSGDLHMPGGKVFHRMVRTVVPELQFVGAPAKSQTAELVSQADAEDG